MGENQENLPVGWIKSFSKTLNRPYYYNEKRKRSVWAIEDIELPENELNKRQRLDVPIREEKPVELVRPSAQSSKIHTIETQFNNKIKLGDQNQRNTGINVAIIVPFRDEFPSQKRSEQLKKFVKHISVFLEGIDTIGFFHIFVIEQGVDNRKFNKGKLYNCGFKVALNFAKKRSNADTPFQFDSFIFHSVHLLPEGEDISQFYAKVPENPIHIARCFERTRKINKYFGGIVAFSQKDFELIDGYPNNYWGWGGCDDELYQRVNDAGLSVSQTRRNMDDALTDLDNLSYRNKQSLLRKNPKWKCMNRWEVEEELRDLRNSNGVKAKPPWWGCANVFYIELEISFLTKKATKYTVDIGDNINEDGTIHETALKYSKKNNFKR